MLNVTSLNGTVNGHSFSISRAGNHLTLNVNGQRERYLTNLAKEHRGYRRAMAGHILKLAGYDRVPPNWVDEFTDQLQPVCG